MLKRFLPQSIADSLPNFLKNSNNADAANKLSNMKPTAPEPKDNKDGYSDVERQDMNSLFDALGSDV